MPAGTRGWECIPGVIRDDGVETFRVEVTVSSAVNGVTLDAISVFLSPPETPPVTLRSPGGAASVHSVNV